MEEVAKCLQEEKRLKESKEINKKSHKLLQKAWNSKCSHKEISNPKVNMKANNLKNLVLYNKLKTDNNHQTIHRANSKNQ